MGPKFLIQDSDRSFDDLGIFLEYAKWGIYSGMVRYFYKIPVFFSSVLGGTPSPWGLNGQDFPTNLANNSEQKSEFFPEKGVVGHNLWPNFEQICS